LAQAAWIEIEELFGESMLHAAWGVGADNHQNRTLTKKKAHLLLGSKKSTLLPGFWNEHLVR